MVGGRRRAALGAFTGASANMLAASLQALLLLPLYLDRLGAPLYGAWLASGEVLVWMLAFDGGIPNLITQKVAAAMARHDETSAGEIFAAGMTILSLIAGLLWLVLLAVAPLAPGWLHLTGKDAQALTFGFAIAATTTCAMLVDYGFHGLARGLQNTASIYRFAVSGTLLGCAVTAWLLLQGWGVAAIALGLVVRIGTALLGSVLFFLRLPASFRATCRVRREVVQQTLRISPPMFFSGVAYAAMNNSGITLAAVMFRPEIAAVYGITKRIVDLAKSFSDMIGFSVQGGFAHLYAEGNLDRTRQVYREIHATYAVVALTLLSAVVAVNPSLISVWVGPSSFGGPVLSATLALVAFTGGASYVAVNLYRATGAIVAGSWAIVVEALIRIPLMALAARFWGTAGLPLAGIATSIALGLWAHTQCRRLMHVRTQMDLTPWFGRITVVAAAVMAALQIRTQGWPVTLAYGLACLVVAGLGLTLSEPFVRPRILRRVGGLR